MLGLRFEGKSDETDITIVEAFYVTQYLRFLPVLRHFPFET